MYIQTGIADEKANESVPVNCSGYNSSHPVNCSSISWAESDSNGSVRGCSVELYTGSVCSHQLMSWQECALGQAENIYLELIPEQYTQEERERDAAQLLYFLRELLI